jgi:hypothetical protein
MLGMRRHGLRSVSWIGIRHEEAARSGELPDQAAAADRAVAPRVAETP